jgi:hypothetical protein
MGLYIHYSGRLKNNDRLHDLIADVINYCDKYEWGYHEYGENSSNDKDDEFKLRGISFGPPECKFIHLTFDKDGKLYNLRYHLLSDKENADLFPELKEFSTMNPVSAKTLEAGYLGHKRIILLFKDILQKHFVDFTFNDDANYWDHQDDRRLANYFGLTDIKLGVLKDIIKHSPGSGMEFEEMIHIHSTSRKTQRWLDGDLIYRELYPECP